MRAMSRKGTRPTVTHIPKPSPPWPPLKAPASDCLRRHRSRSRATRRCGRETRGLETLGLSEAGLDRVIHAGYSLLDLITFFTSGPKESRAWTVAVHHAAPAAGKIHTDFERGFIAAETISYADFIECNGEQGAKDTARCDRRPGLHRPRRRRHFVPLQRLETNFFLSAITASL